ncbi:lipocalin family protein [Bacillaceae bacterium IKA-2]|nr:lipocalin family protein [Bacillaceae bacterium IKA-2]
MIEKLPKQIQISLPKDTAPHSGSNIEWWYFFAFLNGDKGGQYALMASFFRVGEFEFQKSHYLIYTLIDLNNKTKQAYSIIDSKLEFNMVSTFLPLYLLLHPTDKRIWKLYKSLLMKQIPKPHTKIKKATIKKNPTQLIYGDNKLTFFGEKQDSFNVRLIEKNLEINLQFIPTKPIALIGGDGKPGDLYYYSFTKNKVQGKIQTDKGIENVKGEGWFDHQWGRDYGILKGSGWNWFGLQLEDGRELLINEEMRPSKETHSPMANLIEEDGSVRFTRNVHFQAIKYWKSLKTNARYPIEWKISIPEFSMELHVSAVFSAQEMPIIGPMQAIWEGATVVVGQETLPNGKRKTVEGKGFMELVGYTM